MRGFAKNRLLIFCCIFTFLFICSLFSAESLKSQTVKNYKVKVVETLNHDKGAYTQGLFFYNNMLYESCGEYGSSTLRRVDLQSGKVLQIEPIPSNFFAEGSVILNNVLYLLTWREKKCLIYNKDTFKKIGELPNSKEGWGLTTDGENLIMSDGSSQIFFVDPLTFAFKRVINVTLDSYFFN